MNLLWIGSSASPIAIPRSDRRYSHIVRVLKKKPGDELAAGRADGTIGHASVLSIDTDQVIVSYSPESEAPRLHPLRVLIGFPRPIQAGRILKDLTSLGVESIWFTLSELGEKSYAESNFFRNHEFEAHLVEGAEQSGNPRLPSVEMFWTLERALSRLGEVDEQASNHGAKGADRVVLHPNHDFPRLSSFVPSALPLTIAIGSERGWTEPEISMLRSSGFTAHSLGRRILKTETAALAAVSICLGNLGIL